MVDSFDTTQTVGLDGDAAARGGLAGFVATTTGKLVLGGVAIVVLLVAIGAIVFLYMFNAPEPEPAIIVPGSATATGSAEATVVARPAPTLQDTFAFRNIFEPSSKPAKITQPGTGTGGTGSGSTDGTGTVQTSVDPADVPADTIYLDSIRTVDGVKKATFIWNGNVYVVSEGQQLEGTPWRLVRIEGNTAIMLFGDATTTLTVGQGLTK